MLNILVKGRYMFTPLWLSCLHNCGYHVYTIVAIMFTQLWLSCLHHCGYHVYAVVAIMFTPFGLLVPKHILYFQNYFLSSCIELEQVRNLIAYIFSETC